MKRIIIHTKDVMIITGKSERYSRYLIKKIKEEIGKREYQYLTIREFCEYLGLNPDEVRKFCFERLKTADFPTHKNHKIYSFLFMFISGLDYLCKIKTFFKMVQQTS